MSAVNASLSEQKSVPKRKKAIVKKKVASLLTAVTTKPQVVPAPEADDGWLAVKNGKKKNGTPLALSSTVVVCSSKVNKKNKNGASLVPPSGVVSSSKGTKKDSLTTNAFHLPKELVKHLHKAPLMSTTSDDNEAKMGGAKDAIVVPPQLTTKSQLRAQKRGKKRAEKAKLLMKAQELCPFDQFEAKKNIQTKAIQAKPKKSPRTASPGPKRP